MCDGTIRNRKESDEKRTSETLVPAKTGKREKERGEEEREEGRERSDVVTGRARETTQQRVKDGE